MWRNSKDMHQYAPCRKQSQKLILTVLKLSLQAFSVKQNYIPTLKSLKFRILSWANFFFFYFLCPDQISAISELYGWCIIPSIIWLASFNRLSFITSSKWYLSHVMQFIFKLGGVIWEKKLHSGHTLAKGSLSAQEHPQPWGQSTACLTQRLFNYSFVTDLPDQGYLTEMYLCSFILVLSWNIVILEH